MVNLLYRKIPINRRSNLHHLKKLLIQKNILTGNLAVHDSNRYIELDVAQG